MKTSFVTLLSLLVLSASTAFGQFSSSPAEPGLRDHLKANAGVTSHVVSEMKMEINGVSAEWVSQDQITLSADVITLKDLTNESRERVNNQIMEYNVSAPVGTLSMIGEQMRMIHFVNPRLVSPAEIARTVEIFKVAVDAQRKNFDVSVATR